MSTRPAVDVGGTSTDPVVEDGEGGRVAMEYPDDEQLRVLMESDRGMPVAAATARARSGAPRQVMAA